MRDVPTEAMGVWQERIGRPSICTVQAPHWAAPQPNLGAFQVERVAQHPEQRGFAIDFDAVLRAVDFK